MGEGLRAGQHPGALALQRPHRPAAPGVVGEALVADAQRFPEADALVEQVQRYRLLAGVELLAAPRRGEGDDPHGAKQLAAARDVDVLGDEPRLWDEAVEGHHDERGVLDAGALRRVVERRLLGLDQVTQRAVGVGQQQPNHGLGERQDLDLDLRGREPHDDVVALQGAVADGEGILGGQAVRRYGGKQDRHNADRPTAIPPDRPAHVPSSLTSSLIASRSSATPYPVRALVTIAWSASRPSSSRTASARRSRCPRGSLSLLVSAARTRVPAAASASCIVRSSTDGSCRRSSSHTAPTRPSRSNVRATRRRNPVRRPRLARAYPYPGKSKK